MAEMEQSQNLDNAEVQQDIGKRTPTISRMRKLINSDFETSDIPTDPTTAQNLMNVMRENTEIFTKRGFANPEARDDHLHHLLRLRLYFLEQQQDRLREIQEVNRMEVKVQGWTKQHLRDRLKNLEKQVDQYLKLGFPNHASWQAIMTSAEQLESATKTWEAAKRTIINIHRLNNRLKRFEPPPDVTPIKFHRHSPSRRGRLLRRPQTRASVPISGDPKKPIVRLPPRIVLPGPETAAPVLPELMSSLSVTGRNQSHSRSPRGSGSEGRSRSRGRSRRRRGQGFLRDLSQLLVSSKSITPEPKKDLRRRGQQHVRWTAHESLEIPQRI